MSNLRNIRHIVLYYPGFRHVIIMGKDVMSLEFNDIEKSFSLYDGFTRSASSLELKVSKSSLEEDIIDMDKTPITLGDLLTNRKDLIAIKLPKLFTIYTNCDLTSNEDKLISKDEEGNLTIKITGKLENEKTFILKESPL